MNQGSRNECNSILLCPENVHTFSLKPLHEKAAIRENLCISFNPIQLSDSQSKGPVDCPVSQNTSSKSNLLFATLPRFNFDKDSSTQAFISEAQSYASSGWSQNGYNLGLNAVNRAFQRRQNLQNVFRRDDDSLSQQNILQPKPANNYCSVCKETFTDYLKHIEHKVHKKKLKESPFNQEIDFLINTFHSNESKVKKSKVQKEVSLVFQWPVLRNKALQVDQKQQQEVAVSSPLSAYFSPQEDKKRRREDFSEGVAVDQFSFGQKKEHQKRRIVQNSQFLLPQSIKINVKCSVIKNVKLNQSGLIHSQFNRVTEYQE